MTGPTSEDTYALGRSQGETARLILQNQMYSTISRSFFQQAGIGPGMTVLDVGSGAGDVAFLLADLVGPAGRVIGVDMNPAILEVARSRAQSAGLLNVEFVVGDATDPRIGTTTFDAVAGRWVLMYFPNPVEALKRYAALLRSGGILTFQEIDLSYPPASFPQTDIHRRHVGWTVPPPGTPGPELRMGFKLFRTFQDAGFAAPQMQLAAPVGGGPGWPGYTLLTETLRSLLPMLEGVGLVKAADVDIDTFAARMGEEATRERAVTMLAMLVAAWVRRP